MYKSETILKLKKQKIVVVIRGESFNEGYQASLACIKGKLNAIEVAYTNNNADKIIKQLTNDYKNNQDVLVGAGTVLDAETARNAIIAGAKYIVSPSFNIETATMCNRYTIPYIPGCMTIKDIVEAMESGCEIIKLFPGSAFGSQYINAIKGPLPYATIMVTGGVNINNAISWLKDGAEIIGIGGEFNNLASTNEYEKITKLASDYVNAISGTN